MNFNDIKKAFEQNENRENAIEMSRYMKDKFKFYGIPSPKRKELSKAFISDAKKSKIVDWKLLNACYKDEHRELQYFANDYLMAMNKYLTYEDIENILVYAKTKQWWDTIDFLDKIIGNIGLYDNRVNDLMIELSKSDDMWLRRLAIDHQNGRKEKIVIFQKERGQTGHATRSQPPRTLSPTTQLAPRNGREYGSASLCGPIASRTYRRVQLLTDKQ